MKTPPLLLHSDAVNGDCSRSGCSRAASGVTDIPLAAIVNDNSATQLQVGAQVQGSVRQTEDVRPNNVCSPPGLLGTVPTVVTLMMPSLWYACSHGSIGRLVVRAHNLCSTISARMLCRVTC